MSVFRKVAPCSELYRPYHTRGEYLLEWLATSGGLRLWFFSSTKGQAFTKYSNVPIYREGSARSIPLTVQDEVTTSATGLDFDSFEYVRSIMESNCINIVGKDSSRLPVCIKGGKVATLNKLKGFRVVITLCKPFERVMGV